MAQIIVVAVHEQDARRVVDYLEHDDYRPHVFADLNQAAAFVNRDATAEQPIEIGSLVIDYPRRDVTVDGTPVQLRERELTLLRHLAQDPDRFYTRAELAAAVWPGFVASSAKTRTVDAHLCRLRCKLGAGWIQNRWGVGWRLNEHRAAVAA